MELSGHSIKFTSLGQTVWAWKSSKKKLWCQELGLISRIHFIIVCDGSACQI